MADRDLQSVVVTGKGGRMTVFFFYKIQSRPTHFITVKISSPGEQVDEIHARQKKKNDEGLQS